MFHRRSRGARTTAGVLDDIVSTNASHLGRTVAAPLACTAFLLLFVRNVLLLSPVTWRGRKVDSVRRVSGMRQGTTQHRNSTLCYGCP
jgi:hypothetical protein